jgi:hypothetical protein
LFQQENYQTGLGSGLGPTYHYLQRSLRQNNKPLFRKVVARALTRLGIWFPPSAYSVLPIVLPHVVRDPGCRRPIDEWSSPNSAGYVRDDNSLIKGLVKSFTINSNFGEYSDRNLGNGFVAAHVWSKVGDTYASRDPATYSFLPNLVWLPATLAKLTDVDQSFAQAFIQALSYKIYRDVDVHETLRPFVAHSWSLLPVPEVSQPRLPDVNGLSFFGVPQRFLHTRVDRIRAASSALLRVAAGDGESIRGKVLHTRYTVGLTASPPVVSADAAKRLGDHLGNYADCVEAAIRAD